MLASCLPILVSLLSPQGLPQWEQETVTIDDSQQFQTWEGFGAAVVYHEGLPDALQGSDPKTVRDLSFLQSGSRRLRLRIPHELETDNDDASATYMNFGGFSFGHWYTAQRSAYLEAKARGVDFVWASCFSPPAWMKRNAPSGGSLLNGGELDPAYYEEFAEFLAAYVIGLAHPHTSNISDAIEIDAISILNEPDYQTIEYESTPISAVEYAKLLRIVAARFAAEGLTTQILGPECGDVAGTTNYLQAIVNDTTPTPAIDLLDGVITHEYGGPTKSGRLQWEALDLLAATHGKQLGQTEVANLGFTNDSILAGLGDANGTGISDWILTATNHSSCNHWSYFNHWWDVEEPSDPGFSARGLIRIDGTADTYAVPKRFRVFQHYAAHIQPGAVRIAGVSSTGASGVSAWLRPVGGRKEYTIVLSNKNATGQLITLSLPAAPSGPVTSYLTTVNDDHASSVSSPGGSSFQVELPKESIKTLIIPMGVPGDVGVEVQMTPGVLTAGGTFDLNLRYHAPASSPPNVHVILARLDPAGQLWYCNGTSWSQTFGFFRYDVTLTDSVEAVFDDRSANFFGEGRSAIYAALLDASNPTQFVGQPSWMDVIADL